MRPECSGFPARIKLTGKRVNCRELLPVVVSYRMHYVHISIHSVTGDMLLSVFLFFFGF